VASAYDKGLAKQILSANTPEEERPSTVSSDEVVSVKAPPQEP